MTSAVYRMYPEADFSAANFLFADKRISRWWAKRCMGVASFIPLPDDEQPSEWPEGRFFSADDVRDRKEVADLIPEARKLYIAYCDLLHDRGHRSPTQCRRRLAGRREQGCRDPAPHRYRLSRPQRHRDCPKSATRRRTKSPTMNWRETTSSPTTSKLTPSSSPPSGGLFSASSRAPSAIDEAVAKAKFAAQVPRGDAPTAGRREVNVMDAVRAVHTLVQVSLFGFFFWGVYLVVAAT